MFKWLFSNREKSTSVVLDVAMKANIADKLRNYNADQDTTICKFSLGNDGKRKMTTNKMTSVKNVDVWGQANPSETGKWSKEDRRKYE